MGRERADALSLENVQDGGECGFRVEGVEDGFDEQRIHSAFEEGLHLLSVSEAELIERHGSETWVVDIGRE